jgi:hypothetical protein
MEIYVLLSSKCSRAQRNARTSENAVYANFA